MSVITIENAAPHVVLVTFRRPEARNSINGSVAKALDAIVKQVESDPDIWVAILTGEGVAFSAGADLKEVAAGRLDDLYTPDGEFAGFVKHARSKLWIAAVEGFALAGGCELALACDLIVAAEGAVFSLPEVTRGMVAAAGGIYRLARVIPRNIAIEIIATGDRLTAERATQLGMVNRLVPNGEAVTAALSLADRITANAPIAVRESVNVARSAFDLNDDALFQMGLAAQERVKQTEDFKEGPVAFIEKRPARWAGR